MSPERYHDIEFWDSLLTPEEQAEGWHFCPEWDFMLVGPGMPELEACLCERQPGA